MLSKKSGQLYQAVLKWCNTYGGMPFIWNGHRGKVSVTKKGNRRWALAIILQFFSCLFITLRIIQIVLHFGGHSPRWKSANNCSTLVSKLLTPETFRRVKFDIGVTYCIIYAMIHIYLVAVLMNTVGKYKELVLFINSYLKFTTHFREAYAIRLPRSWHNGCEEWVQIMISFAVLVPIVPTIHFLMNPLHPQFYTSIIVSFVDDDDGVLNYNANLPKIISKYGKVIPLVLVGTFIIFQIFFVWTIASALLFVTVNVTISAYVFNSAIKQMTIIPPKNVPPPTATTHHRHKRRSQYLLPSSYVTRDKLRTCHSLVKCYRSFQITRTLAHQGFADIAFVVEFLQIVLNSFVIVTLFRFYDKMTTGSVALLLVWISLNCLTWTFILSIVGRFENKTERCRQSWKYVKYNFVEEIRYMKLVKKSCHPIVFTAKYFKMRIRHVPYFLYCVVCGAVVWSVIYQLFMDVNA